MTLNLLDKLLILIPSLIVLGVIINNLKVSKYNKKTIRTKARSEKLG